MIDLKTARVSILIGAVLFLAACGAKFQSSSNDEDRSSTSLTNPPGVVFPLPAPVPMPVPAPSNLGGYPDNENTGVPTAFTLKSSAAVTVSVPGTVIDGLDIKGSVNVTANNVTIKRSKITVAGFVAVRISADLTGVVIEDCDIDGVGAGNEGSIGIQGPGSFLRNNIFNVESGIAPSSGALVQDNYIHDLKASGAPTYNGILIEGGVNNILIHHNSVINPMTQTSAIMIDNFFGAVVNIKVDENLLAGGSYTVFSDGQYAGSTISGISFIGNHMRSGKLGYTLFNHNSPVFNGNVDDATLDPVP